MSQYLQPSIILLREGTDDSQGKGQLINNISACEAVGNILRTTLGPRGMDKLVVHSSSNATISNDGAEVLKLLEIVHPAAKMLVDIARSQDVEVGDGTTTVTILACEFLKESRTFIEDGMHAQIIVKGFRKAARLALEHLETIEQHTAMHAAGTNQGVTGAADAGAGIDTTVISQEFRSLLERCAKTALNSKLIARNKDFFAPLCVNAVLSLEDQSQEKEAATSKDSSSPSGLEESRKPRRNYDLRMIGIKKVTGGSVKSSMLVDGVAFKKTFSYAGFEQQPKKIENPGVLLLKVELELKSERDNAEVRISDPQEYESIVEAEWKIIYGKLDACVATGAKVILSRLPIGDLATQYFADRGLFCAGRVSADDLDRVATATGGKIQTTTNGLSPEILGHCGMFEEKQIGGERFNFLTKCKEARAATILLRGGSEQFVEEAHRSLHDALMVVKRTIQSKGAVVAGAGSVEIALATFLREKALEIPGKQQMVVEAFARALEIIPEQLVANAGHDSTEILNELRKLHYQHRAGSTEHADSQAKCCWMGVDIENGGVLDAFKEFIWEPASNKRNAISAAAEAACLILTVDETVRNPQSEQSQIENRRGGGAGGGGQGAPMSQAMGGQGMQSMSGAPGVRTLQGKGGR